MLTMRKLHLLVCLISLIIFFIPFNSVQAAICAFRDPDRDVYRLFPEATGYKSIFTEIDGKNRLVIEEALGQPLDINDIGIHTLYIVLKDTMPIGFIHAHGTLGRYGNVEVIWAFNLNGSIKDYIIQRSREKKTKELESEEFRKQFRGKKLGDPFMLGNSKEINIQFIQPPEGAEKESSIIAYGAKTVLILGKYLFQEEIEKAVKEAGEQYSNK